jgi:hypothetical protein
MTNDKTKTEPRVFIGGLLVWSLVIRSFVIVPSFEGSFFEVFLSTHARGGNHS